MTLCRMVCPPQIEEEQNRLADEWLEIDTTLSISDYIYHNGSNELKAYYDKRDGASDEGW